MSSILDALRKVEADAQRRPIRLPPAPPRPRGRLAAVVAAAAFVAGAGVVALVVGLRPDTLPEPVADTSMNVASAPPVEPPAPSPTTATPPATAAPLAPPPAAPAAPAPSPPTAASAPSVAPVPAAPVGEAPTEEIDEERLPEEADLDPDVPEQITILRPSPEPAPAPQAEVQVEALPAPAPAAPPIDVLAGPPAGAPQIHVSFLIYSAAPERRQVSLTIDNGPLLTLHEGQKAGSISLVRILRDRIHVEHGGRTFSVRAVL